MLFFLGVRAVIFLLMVYLLLGMEVEMGMALVAQALFLSHFQSLQTIQ